MVEEGCLRGMRRDTKTGAKRDAQRVVARGAKRDAQRVVRRETRTGAKRDAQRVVARVCLVASGYSLPPGERLLSASLLKETSLEDTSLSAFRIRRSAHGYLALT